MSQLWNNKLCLRGDSSKLASSISDASLKSADLTSELIGCFACAHPSAGSCRWLGEFICRATSRVKRGIGRWHFVNPVDCTSVPRTCGPRYIIIVDCFVSSARVDFFFPECRARGRTLLLLVSFLQSRFVDSFNRNLNKLLNTTVKLHLNSHCQSDGLLGVLLNGIRIPVPPITTASLSSYSDLFCSWLTNWY